MRISVIIPTYCEEGNIIPLLEKVKAVMEETGFSYEIIVMDDSSPDRTVQWSKEFFEKYNSGRVIVRKENPGLASSVLEGFRNSCGDILVVMDADLSHPPEVIPKLLAPIIEGEADFVVASRYIKGGGVEGWTLQRQIISRIASWFGRVVLGGVHDPASGFFAIRAELVKNCDFEVKGFKICTELLARCKYKKAVEVPYIFKERASGKSKLKFTTILNYLAQILAIVCRRKSK